MDFKQTNSQNSQFNTLTSNMAKMNQTQQLSSIRPYQKLSRNQQIRNQSDIVQFESPPAFTDYSHKQNGISPFMSNTSNQQNEKKQVSLNLNNQILQDVSNKSSYKSPRQNSHTAPSSPIKPILVKKTAPKKSIVEFNVTMNKLEEKEIANENDLSNVHFSLNSNQDLDQCTSSRTNTTHKKSAQETVNESLYQLREEMRPPQMKPIVYPIVMEKDNPNMKIILPFETKDKPFQVTCDSHRNTKGSPRNLRDQNDSQLEDIYLLERYSQDNRLINKLNFNNKFQPQNQNIGQQQNLIYHGRNDRQEQERKSSLSNISMTAKNNTSQLIQNYSSEELQYKLNYSSRYLPSSRSDLNEKLDPQTKKKIEQNTPKFNRNTTCDSGQRGVNNPHKVLPIAPLTQEFNVNSQQEFNYNYNDNPSSLLKNRQPSPNSTSSAQKYLFGADDNSKIANRSSNANEQLTVDDLDLMRQFQIEAYNNFISNPAHNSGSQKNIIDSARKRDFSPNTIINTNLENKSIIQNSTINQNNNNNSNNSQISNSRYQQQQYLTNTDAQSIYSANMQKYCEGDNFSINKQQSKPQEYVNCSPLKSNQSNLQFIHDRLARQKEVIMNNANFHLENSGNIKNKSQRMSPSKDRLQINTGENNTDVSQISNIKSNNKINDSASILSPQKMRSSKLSPKDKLPEYLKFSNQKSSRSQAPNSQLKKWKEQSNSIGWENSLGGMKNLPNKSNIIQKIQSPQSSASKRDLLEKLLKKSPTSQIPQSHLGFEDTNMILPSIPSENEIVKNQRHKSNSDLIVNETTPNTKMQQILYGRNKEIITPKSNSVTPINKSFNQTPKNTQSNNRNSNNYLNQQDEIEGKNNNQSYRSPKNAENVIQTKQAAIALMLNDKITKRQPSPLNKNSFVQPSPRNRNSALPSPKQKQQINLNSKINSIASSPKNVNGSLSNRNYQVSPRNSQISPRSILQSPRTGQISPQNRTLKPNSISKSPKNYQSSPKQQIQISPNNYLNYSPKNPSKTEKVLQSSPKAIYSTPKHYQHLSETPKSNLNQETQFNEIYRQLNDTKIQNKINMIKSQLQTINQQNNQILQQHESMQQTLQQPCTSANSFNSSQNPPTQYDQNRYQTPQQFYYPQSGAFNNSNNTVTTTTVTTVHTYNKNSPQKSTSRPPLYSPINSKYSDLELTNIPAYVQSNISNTPHNDDFQRVKQQPSQKLPFTLDPNQEQVFVKTPQSNRKSEYDGDYEQRKRQSNKIDNLYKNQTANNSPMRNRQDSAIFDIQFPKDDNVLDDQDINKPLSDYFVARKAHIAKRLENNKEQSKERSKLKSLTPTNSKERSKTNLFDKRKQVQQQFTKQNSSNIMNISETNSYFFDTNNLQKQYAEPNLSNKSQSRSISPLNSKKNNSNSKPNLNLNDISYISQVSQKNTGLNKTPSSNSLLDRLVKGEKIKMTEKEMREQSKRRYQNLPDVKKQKEEQIKNASKLEDYKKRHEKMKQLDEVWRQKNRSFLQN